LTQPLVISCFLLRVQQAHFRAGNLVEDSLGKTYLLAQLLRPDVRHSLVGSVRNDIRVALECPDAKQAVVVRRLFVGRNAEPDVIGVKLLCHPSGLHS
jgi:hypothetical protein